MKAHTFMLPRDRIANEHREAALLAVARLGRARSGEIRDYINNELRIKITKRAVQAWITKLEKAGLIGRDKYDACYLTEKGKDPRLIANHCGKLNLGKLAELPMSGRKDKDLEEFIIRFGFLLVWHFMSTVLPKKWRKNDLEEGAAILLWVQNSTPITQMFELFMKRFGKQVDNKFYSYMMTEKKRNKLITVLARKYEKYLLAMVDASFEIMNEVLKERGEELDKSLRRFGLLMRSEKGVKVDSSSAPIP